MNGPPVAEESGHRMATRTGCIALNIAGKDPVDCASSDNPDDRKVGEILHRSTVNKDNPVEGYA